MATFRVGQRVKLVRPFHSENFGETGTIVALFAPVKISGGLVNCELAWDTGTGSEWTPYSHTDRLVPATDCYDKADWRECVWQPPHMRESA